MHLAPGFIRNKWRFRILLLTFLATFVWIGARLHWLHIHEANYLQKTAENARIYEEKQPALRGEITYCHGKHSLLADSKMVWDIIIDPWEAAIHLDKLTTKLYKEKIKEFPKPSDWKKTSVYLDCKKIVDAENNEKIQWLAQQLKVPHSELEKKIELRWKKPSNSSAPTRKETKNASKRSLQNSWPSWLAKTCKEFFARTGLIENYYKKKNEEKGKYEKIFPPRTKPPFEGDIPIKRPVIIAKDVDLKQKNATEEKKIAGAQYRKHSKRIYPSGFLATQIIGFMDGENENEKTQDDDEISPQKNKTGRVGFGLEKGKNDFLKPTSGSLLSEKNKLDQEIPWRRKTFTNPIHGARIETTLDRRIQEICEEEAAAAAQLYKPEGITIIVSEPSTGKIRAFANWPTFNPETGRPIGELSEAARKYDLYRNAGISHTYEPGSAFKIVTMSTALNENAISTDEQLDTKSQLREMFVQYRGTKRKLIGGEHNESIKTAREIIKYSSNRGPVLSIMKMTEKAGGEKRFREYIEDFGFNTRTGIYESLGGSEIFEHAGKIPELKQKNGDWVFASKNPKTGKLEEDATAITRIPDGHGIEVTPLQMHFAMSTIANDGKLMKPILVDRIVARIPPQEYNRELLREECVEKVIFEEKPLIRKTPITSTTAATMRHLLREVCLPKGTAQSAECEGYEPAGKTGTAQRKLDKPRLKKDGRLSIYSTTNHDVTFSGFFPFEKPIYVITVVVFDPRDTNDPTVGTRQGAGNVCGPIFKKIVMRMVDTLNIPKATPAVSTVQTN